VFVLLITLLTISIYRSSHKNEIADINEMNNLKDRLFANMGKEKFTENNIENVGSNNDNSNINNDFTTNEGISNNKNENENEGKNNRVLDPYKEQVEVEKFLDKTLDLAEDEDAPDKLQLKEDVSKMTDEEIREQLSLIKQKQLDNSPNTNPKSSLVDNNNNANDSDNDNTSGTLIDNDERIRKDKSPDNLPWAQYEIERIIPNTNINNNERINRENATLFTLCRNSEIYEILDSIQQLENRFNNKFHYDWVFLNEEPFSAEFIKLTSNMVSGRSRYGLIPKKHWSYPSYIDQDKAREIRESRKWSMITYGSSESYRHMCRFNSLFFYKHPIMEEYQYYWRVEPHVKYACDIIEDPFKFLRINNKKYGFTISMRELPNTIETLWQTTKLYFKNLDKNYFNSNSDLNNNNDNNNLLKFISDDNGESYNLCHYWTNFEIANLEIFRNEIYEGYVEHLDHAGGFFYERWGDAPIHSIIFSLILKKEEIYMFQEISYEHTVAKTCPLNFEFRKKARCICDPNDNWVLRSDSSCNLKFLEFGTVEKPKELEDVLKKINDKKDEEELLRVQQRKLRMETARRQAEARRKKAEERRQSRLEAQRSKKKQKEETN
jgi:alpha 1,2-mannosyltransferase